MLNRNKFESHKREILKLLFPFKDQMPQAWMALDRIHFNEKNPFYGYEELKILLEFYISVCDRQVRKLYSFDFFSPVFLYNNYDVALSQSKIACDLAKQEMQAVQERKGWTQ